MPPKSKRNAANQHDKRHENGLAAPGKRIPKQRSAQNLNGSANTVKPKSNTTPPPTASDVAARPMTLPASTNDSVHKSLADADTAGKVLAGTHDARERKSSDASVDAADETHHTHSNGSVDPTAFRRTHDTYESSSGQGGYKGNPLALATTIISSCPLVDVLAILIILLQLGPTGITIIQALFTTLTFITPTASASLSTLPSLNDMFQGSGGSPSWGLILFFDILILIVWLLVQLAPFQNLMVDMSQAVIAISLGGAAAGKGGTTNSLVVCVGIICLSHLARCGFVPQSVLQYAEPLLSKSGLTFLQASDAPTAPRARCNNSYGWIRSGLGTHVLAQGLLRMLRRYLHRRDQLSLPPNTRTDSDLFPTSQSQKSNHQTSDPNIDALASASTDGRPPGLPPASRESKEKPVSQKKRKRHANQVRSQQPFWAAIASTKVVTYREMEESSAANDNLEGSTLSNPDESGASHPSRHDTTFYISNLSATEIAFGAYVQVDDVPFVGSDNESSSASESSECPQPFYIRVNGAVWRSINVRCISTNNLRDDGGALTIWKGEIQGLTAFSNYNVEFVRTSDDRVLYTTSLITASDPCADQSSVAAAAGHQTLRPASPATTLRKSISAADSQLQDIRAKSKRTKKDHRTAVTALKKEVDALTAKLSGSGNSDERQRARLLQLNRDVTVNEEAAAALEAQIQSEADIPEEEYDEHTARKKAWLAEKNRQASIREDFEQSKAQADREVENLQAELTSTVQKRERTETRIAKQNETIARLAAVTAQGKDAQQRRAAERNAQLSSRADLEQQWLASIAQYERGAEDLQYTTSAIYEQIGHLNALYQHNANSIPSTPDGHHASLHNGHLASASRNNPSLAYNQAAFAFNQAHNGTPTGSARRERSSSMLSGVSFTDDDDDVAELPSPHDYKSAFFQPHPIGWGPVNSHSFGVNGTRKGSGGSSSVGTSGSSSSSGMSSGGSAGETSGSGSRSGSLKDPLSPAVTTVTPNSPAGGGSVGVIGRPVMGSVGVGMGSASGVATMGSSGDG